MKTNSYCKIRKYKNLLREATTYEMWKEAAHQLEKLEGKEEWKADDEYEHYNHKLMQQDLSQIRKLRSTQKPTELYKLLQESLYQNLGCITEPALYQNVRVGTKNLIKDYLNEVVRSMNFLCDTPFPQISEDEKLKLFKREYRNYGRSALLLSGGAVFGLYHLGVVKALREQNLLPSIISGASIGAIIAGTICSRSEVELDEFYSNTEQIYLKTFQLLDFKMMLHKKSIMDSKQLFRLIRRNIGNYTFEEAYKKSGRILNISVSPTRSHQKPRVLNYLTAPEVSISYSALASCAIPGIYSPVSLVTKNQHGRHRFYLENEKWIDGSIHSDIPFQRLSRLHNVNHTIVSQTNPHVLPFLVHQQRKGNIPFMFNFATSMAHAIGNEMLKSLQIRNDPGFLGFLLHKMHAILNQKYIGDINIYPSFNPFLYYELLKNPTHSGLKKFILEGERATWPKLEMINDHTIIHRTFEECIQRLQQKVNQR